MTGKFTGDPNEDWPDIAFGLDFIDPNTDSTKRLYLPTSRVTAAEKVTAATTDGAHYAITIQSSYDADIDAHFEYWPGWTVGS